LARLPARPWRGAPRLGPHNRRARLPVHRRDAHAASLRIELVVRAIGPEHQQDIAVEHRVVARRKADQHGQMGAGAAGAAQQRDATVAVPQRRKPVQIALLRDHDRPCREQPAQFRRRSATSPGIAARLALGLSRDSMTVSARQCRQPRLSAAPCRCCSGDRSNRRGVISEITRQFPRAPVRRRHITAARGDRAAGAVAVMIPDPIGQVAIDRLVTTLRRFGVMSR